MSEELQQNSNEFTNTSDFNVLDFMIRSIIKGLVNTAIPVRVDTIERPADGAGAGYMTATPLVKMRTASGEAIDPVSLPRLRWFRLQHGTAAFICDPKPGDIGLAIFAQQDVSAINGAPEPVQPGSFRCFDLSDGFYVGGFWGQKPTTFVRIEDDGNITITAPQTCVINTNAQTINANATCTVNTNKATVNAPESEFTGNVTIQGRLSVVQLISGTGGMTVSGGSGAAVTGSLTTTGDVTAGGISLQGHTHSCPQGGETSEAH